MLALKGVSWPLALALISSLFLQHTVCRGGFSSCMQNNVFFPRTVCSTRFLEPQIDSSADYAPGRCLLQTTLVTALPAMWDGNLPVHFQPSLCQTKAADDGLLLLRSLLHLSSHLQHLLSLNTAPPRATKVRLAAWITFSILLDKEATCYPPVTLHPRV